MEDIMSDQPSPPSTRKKMHALLLGDRIDTSGLERTDVLSTTPLAFRAGQEGVVTVFRYGVVVLFGMSLLEEDEVLRGLRTRIVRPVEPREDETATVEIAANKDEQILPGGPILLQAVTPEHMIVIADALAKSVVLARDEREVSSVIEVIEPFARQLAENGRTPEGGRAILKHVGNALLVQHRVSGRVAVAEKPDAVWDRPDLERLYARLQDEYELKERAEALSRKLALISETAKVLTDIIATKRSLRLELIIVLLLRLRSSLRVTRFCCIDGIWYLLLGRTPPRIEERVARHWYCHDALPHQRIKLVSNSTVRAFRTKDRPPRAPLPRAPIWAARHYGKKDCRVPPALNRDEGRLLRVSVAVEPPFSAASLSESPFAAYAARSGFLAGWQALVASARPAGHFFCNSMQHPAINALRGRRQAAGGATTWGHFNA
jgi:uncharacterized Rmd1/YagE family protein